MMSLFMKILKGQRVQKKLILPRVKTLKEKCYLP